MILPQKTRPIEGAVMAGFQKEVLAGLNQRAAIFHIFTIIYSNGQKMSSSPPKCWC